MKQFPVITTLTAEQRIWLDKKLADKGISHLTKEKEEFIALVLNGPVMTKKQVREMKKRRKSARVGWI